jgi:hypothetical protein
MPSRLSQAVLLLSVFAGHPLAAQVDPVAIELDAFWADVSRTVAEGDFERMQATYHPDGIWEGVNPANSRIQSLSAPFPGANEGFAKTRAGLQVPGLEFRFSSRLHDSTTAHEIGMVHYWVTPKDSARRDSYGLLDSYLVKKDGRWMILVEIQRWGMSKEEWEALE